MPQAVHTGPITPADELRDLLSLSEKRATDARGSAAEAVQLLRDLDRIAVLWPELEAHGLDLKPEAGRWDTIQATVRRHAPRLVQRLRAVGGATAVRDREHPGGVDAWWWHLDAEVRRRNRRTWTRAGLTLAVVVVVGAGLWLLLNALFPVDPAVRESVRALDAGDLLVQRSQDFGAALTEYRRAAEVNPQSADAWLRVGVVLEAQGDATGAAEMFARAKPLTNGDAAYHLSLGSVYFILNRLDPAERELKTALSFEPDNPYAYYYLASVYEARGQGREAVDALEKANQYAEARGDDQLVAMSRYRMGMLMQSQMSQGPAN